MTIFKLSPVDLSRPCWTASAHKGPAIVRANDESLGRRITSAAFNKAVGRPPNWGEIPAPPWGQGSEVVCEEVEDSEYPEDGPEEILDPQKG